MKILQGYSKISRFKQKIIDIINLYKKDDKKLTKKELKLLEIDKLEKQIHYHYSRLKDSHRPKYHKEQITKLRIKKRTANNVYRKMKKEKKPFSA
jgi:hypothetical protein